LGEDGGQVEQAEDGSNRYGGVAGGGGEAEANVRAIAQPTTPLITGEIVRRI
jgi:hypothetical protein